MIKNIAVLGGGTMGHGVAETFAMYGFPVALYSRREQTRISAKKHIKEELEFCAENGLIEKSEIEGIMNNISYTGDLKEAVENADYVIECTSEVLELKQNLFKEIDQYCRKETIFATNTSSLALKEIIKVLPEERQKKCMVNHWYNPAHLMPIAELSYFGNTDEETYKAVEELYNKAGKQTVKVLKDVPGLLANRIQQGVAREVFSLIEMGVAEPADIDKALKFGPAFRYATTGQLEVADMGGLDIWCTVGDNLLSVMDNRKEANPILREKVSEGKLGVKSGQGFFEYPAEKASEMKNAFNRRLIIQLKTSKNY